MHLIAFCCVLLAFFWTSEAHLVTFEPFTSSNCSGASGSLVTLNTGECLNNHDFSKVDCSILQQCLAGNNQMTYQELVECSGAPALSLSINITATEDGSITVHTYPISKTCFGIPVPVHEDVGDCSKLFAFNPDCYPSGQFGLEW